MLNVRVRTTSSSFLAVFSRMKPLRTTNNLALRKWWVGWQKVKYSPRNEQLAPLGFTSDLWDLPRIYGMKLTKPLKNGWNLGSVAHVESNAHTHPKDICAYKNHLHIYPCVLRTASGPHVIQYIYILYIYVYISRETTTITLIFALVSWILNNSESNSKMVPFPHQAFQTPKNCRSPKRL